MIGKTLAHYEITELLGKGGMGEVYRARDTRLKRDVALKILPADMADHPERLDRFQREAEVVAGLNHPHIVTLHSVEEDRGIRFLTMELVEGQDLDQLITPDGLPLSQVCRGPFPPPPRPSRRAHTIRRMFPPMISPTQSYRRETS